MESEKEKFLSIIRGLSELELEFKLNPNTWSIHQIVEHLVITEKGILNYFQKRPPQNARFRLTFRQQLNNYILRLMMLGPFKFKASSKVPGLIPNGLISLSELFAEWNQMRKEYICLLESLPYDNKSSTFRHPRTGFTGTPQTLTFIADHIIHHKHQLWRIIKMMRT